jgi:hypothetical protein
MASLVASVVGGVVSIVSGVCTLVSIPICAGVTTVCTATKLSVKAAETALLPVTYSIGKAVDCYNEKSKKEEEEIELNDTNLVDVRI